MRLHWLGLSALALLGCESLRPLKPNHDPALLSVAAQRSDSSPAPTSQREGPIPRAATANPEPDALALAADCLGRGDSSKAAIHLEAYVCRHPDQLMFRAQLAELLVRVGRDDAARVHLERFVADAQCATGAPRNRLVNAHTRLMEIAQRTDDRFGEVFHRGVGLLILAKEQDKLADADAEFGEEMLCKALKALGEAKELKPTDPRACAYLADAYERSGNRRAAEAERVAARSGFVPGQLSPTERKPVLLGAGVIASSAK